MIRNAAFVLLGQLPLAILAFPRAQVSGWIVLAAWAVPNAFLVTQLLGPRGRFFAPAIWRAAPQPRVALTFDDGPHPDDTPAILAILRAAGARATFFCVGEKARRHPELVRRAAAEGHEIGVHSDTHPWWFSLAPRGRMRREVCDAARTIGELAGRPPRH